ncbi:prepilin peptidase [Streptococcus australis]|uniref:prepilin peptidase n=1 Tax=Streptococcus TaxID=1301 RepID=UPI001021122E|nr:MULTISPECIES: A24 family peptidase [unclassified Streptococcus]MTQ41938.1 prepilin peptidase [Streptococcus sp. BIOML-A1]RYS61193.1 prepilin peptidase [Streptococcus sp. bf_0095]
MINFYFFTVGACIASFLGLVIDRFPESSIICPRSHCDRCQQTLRPLDLIPILSQVLFRFRCRYCQSPLPYWYALFEGWSGLLFLLCYQGFLPIPHLLLLLGSCILAIYDLRSMEYPLLLWLILHTLCLLCTGPTLLMGVFLFLGILSCLYSIGIGAGDFLLLATFSLTLSATQVLLVMQGASLIGLLVFLFKKEKDRIPFVPCLFLSYHALLFFTIFSR